MSIFIFLTKKLSRLLQVVVVIVVAAKKESETVTPSFLVVSSLLIGLISAKMLIGVNHRRNGK